MNTKLYIGIALAVAIGAGHAVAESRSSSSNLTLTAVDREPEQGRKAPNAAKLDELRETVTNEPKNRQARFELVQALIRADKLDDALAAANEWRSSDAYNLVVVRLLGDIHSELGNQREALRAYSAVVELLPKDAKAQRALASVLKQTGNLQAAYERLAAASALRPEDTRVSFELADVAQRMGKLSDARMRFENIVADEDTSMAVRYPAKQRLAQIYTQMRLDAARDGDADTDSALAKKVADLDIEGGVENDIKIYLTWDTDRSDVDLWVTNPAKEKVYYGHKKGRYGGSLYGDVTTGYGPESFTAPRARKGLYTVRVNYFSAGRSNFPEARGEVVVVLNEGTVNETRHVLPYRLFNAGQTVTVARIRVR